MYVISKLCKTHIILPSSCVILGEIARVGDDPLFMGGFADVYRGQLGVQKVAMKVLRMYGGTYGSEEVMKASYGCPKILRLLIFIRHSAKRLLYGDAYFIQM